MITISKYLRILFLGTMEKRYEKDLYFNTIPIIMKKTGINETNQWKKATKPFRDASKKARFSKVNLKKLIISSRINLIISYF